MEFGSLLFTYRGTGVVVLIRGGTCIGFRSVFEFKVDLFSLCAVEATIVSSTIMLCLADCRREGNADAKFSAHSNALQGTK